VPDPHEGSVLTLVVKGVFALQIRERDDMLLARLLGFHDDEDVPETHAPPMPNIVEATSAPYRRPSTDTRKVR
jgi:hypothetical protein